MANHCALVRGAVLPLCLAAALHAADAHLASAPRLDVPYLELPDRIDVVTDEMWRVAAVIANLPPCGQDRPSLTEVRVMWHEAALFVRFICRDEHLVHPFHERDADHHLGDVCEVFLDCSGDARSWYEFQVTPRNHQLDSVTVLTVDAMSRPDGLLLQEICVRDMWSFRSWDCPDLQTRTRLTEEGWIADLRIPGHAVLRRTGTKRFAPGPVRAHLVRHDYDPGQGPEEAAFSSWTPLVRGNPHRSPHAMGTWNLVRSGPDGHRAPK